MRYTLILEQEPDGGYVAIVPALPGCITQGDTRDEVLKNIREAADLYIEDCIVSGDPVPAEDVKKSGTVIPSSYPHFFDSQLDRRVLAGRFYCKIEVQEAIWLTTTITPMSRAPDRS